MSQLAMTLGKELAESFIRWGKRLLVSKAVKKECHNECAGLNSFGFHVVERFLSKEQCAELIQKIDSYIESGSNNVWTDGVGADNRIYFIDTINEQFKKFYDTPYFKKVLESYTGIKKPVGMLLAGRIDSVEGNVGSGGGWHRDSPIQHQVKAICYLTDVGKDNGPFQYISESHKKLNIIKSYVCNVFKPGQYRFTESEIDKYIVFSKGKVLDMVAPAGTLLFADTKGIHRGKPIIEGRRYVLFCYYWDGKIPAHFENLSQNAIS